MTTPTVADSRRWITQGTTLCDDAASALTEAELREPSLLPDWSRAHVLAHVARNAEAVGRLLHWASTGDETPMYPSRAERNADIESTSQQKKNKLVADFRATAKALDAAMAAMKEADWQNLVVTGKDHKVPARVAPWLRSREVLVHAIDLNTGLTFADLPADFLIALADDIAAARAKTPDLAMTLVVQSLTPDADSETRWDLPGIGAPVVVRGDLASLTAYLAGRGSDGVQLASSLTAPDAAVPTLSPWL